jgi:uncharacterized protein
MISNETVINHTKKWIADVIVTCNFCPFAARVLKPGKIHFEVMENADLQTSLEALVQCFTKLDTDESIETLLLIFPDSYKVFDDYLELVELSEALLEDQDYEGIYQIASFHPEYLFAGSTDNDPANYTNRSPYPMLHLLREESVSRAIDGYPDADKISDRNIKYANQKGLLYMQQLWASCFRDS